MAAMCSFYGRSVGGDSPWSLVALNPSIVLSKLARLIEQH